MSAKYNFTPTLHLSLQTAQACSLGQAASQPSAGAGRQVITISAFMYRLCQALCKILHILLASQVSWREELFFFAVRKQEVSLVGGNREKWTSVKK